MPTTVTVLYPNDVDADYDLNYYLTHHMPLLDKLWGTRGLKGWTYTKYTPSPNGSPQPYVFGCSMTWESGDAMKAAFSGPGVKEAMADVAKFSNKQPIMLFGERLAQGGRP
ncbi:hypothetical protein F9C07_1484821 [Aspergillus flavus]|uniref:EthD domain-containing protein n=2 Tax=Aspergillus flavus TaxID=5059 RepID=A0A7U2MNJ4_ASPFN|nr:uncharacterized protein G4B84_005821 [Aspergillus flavus NRRL3357]KAJ1706552.1 hypothetical protein NYO67_11301 [Aspergillus flavus]KAF7621035.1 hypothetical protein AFLA_006326 [Aspergillus flavus NRRL3357]QMW30486.1 hypothetical protein G4B84_005821 [Aspergillus flavus NRRL3357]QRD86988.1 hypothetical protein F9C07_1484821 [Aspergillus flavus]RAQ56958.1 hypothetical protein COH20_009210 [Aspergillus flavus]